MIFTDPVHTPAAIAGYLLDRGLDSAKMCVLEDLGQPGERLTWLTLEEARERRFAPLNLVVVLPDDTSPVALSDTPFLHPLPLDSHEDKCHSDPAAPGLPALHLGMPEEALVHEQGLITKAEVRAVVLAKLALQPGQVLWDIGAGCGSVSLEASLLLKGGRIFAIEQNPERAEQIEANRERFHVPNLEVLVGQAPACLEDLPSPQRVFIGGGGRRVGDIIAAVLPRLGSKGRVVLTATLLDTLEQARRALAQKNWQVEVVQVQVSRTAPLGSGVYLRGLNPVWIVTAWH